jgi:hypothetical protein
MTNHITINKNFNIIIGSIRSDVCILKAIILLRLKGDLISYTSYLYMSNKLKEFN